MIRGLFFVAPPEQMSNFFLEDLERLLNISIIRHVAVKN
jgi:hypothetical protein